MKKCCFVISPIGSEGSETRKRSDQILKYVIEPAMEECGYETCIRADKLAEPGMITSQIIQHIVEDTLVVADLSEKNPNVFYELAIRHALRKPLIQIIQKGEPLPFDVANMRTIQVNIQDLDSVNDAKIEMIKQIKSVENKQPDEIETPISISLDLQLLKQSDKPEQRSLAELVSVIGSLRADILNIEEKIENNAKFQTSVLQNYLIKNWDKRLNYLHWSTKGMPDDCAHLLNQTYTEKLLAQVLKNYAQKEENDMGRNEMEDDSGSSK